jgi:hypothetical protein
LEPHPKDYDVYGNITRIRGPHNIHCEETTYDKYFSQLQAVRKLYVDPGCTGAAITSAYATDRGLEKVTLALAPDLSLSAVEYDPFGRPTRTTKPDPDTGFPSGLGTTVQYFDVPNPHPNVGTTMPQLTKTTATDGNTTSVTWAYTDGFGKGMFTISNADTEA